jgi:SAM-dependent methyltransferase
LTADFYQQNAETLGETLRGSDFDLIYSFGVIHHSPSPEKIIEQIRLLSNPNTEVRIMLYSKFSWKVFWILMKYGRGAFWRLPQLVAKYSEAETGCPITYTYSFKDVRKLMKGFEILELRKEHIFPYRIDKYVNYEYEKVWYFKLLPERLFRSLEHRIGWHTLVVARPSP